MKKKPVRGRPKKPNGCRELLSVYFEPGEIEKIVRLAESEHMSASAWAARAVRAALS